VHQPPQDAIKCFQDYIPIFPNKQKPEIDDGVPIRPTPKPQINPSHVTKGVESMASQMQQLNLDHAKAMKAKEVEIHFLHCTATDSSLETVNALMAKKELKDLTLSKNLPDWEKNESWRGKGGDQS